MNFSGGSPGTATLITNAHKSCCVPFTNALSPYIIDANATWSSGTITRYNAAFQRLTAWDRNVSFRAVVAPDAVNADTDFAVIQNGTYFGKYVCAADGVIRKINIFGLTPGATVEIWEPRQNAVNAGAGVNSGTDVQHASGYITGLYLPTGVAAPTPATCTTGIVWLTMSIPNYTTDATPSCYYSALGQGRLLAHAKGWLLGDLTYGAGTLCGDGYTAAQRAADINRLYVAMGSPATFKVYLDIARNDYAYSSIHGVTTTPTQWTTFAAALRTAVLALIPAATFFVNTTIAQDSEVAIDGFTLPNWRTQIATLSGWTVISGTALTITTPTYRDNVHLTAAGAQRYGYGPNATDGVFQALGLA